MPIATIEIQNETLCKISGLSAETRRRLSKLFSYEIPGARHMPAFKLGRWDGKETFFQISGQTYVNLLPEIIPLLEEENYEIGLDDKREYDLTNFDFDDITEESFAHKTWPTKHQLAGQPIMLRDYQVHCVNQFLQNPQSLAKMPTGSGKCIDYNTLISIKLDKSTKFGIYYSSLINDTSITEFISVRIGHLIESIELYLGIELDYNDAELVDALNIKILSPTLEYVPINYIIIKRSAGVSITLSTGVKLVCANKHILYHNNNYNEPVTADLLRVGDNIRTLYGLVEIESIEHVKEQSFYDVGLPAPHLYADMLGFIHHNTIIVAALCNSCEKYGRTITIVPNKTLVSQTEEDFINLQLDVGVYFGGRKELNKTHTICTWQSLGILMKNNDADVPIDKFLSGVCCVICDECHTCSATVLRSLLNGPMGHIQIRWGLTGTIPKLDLQFRALQTSIGDIVKSMQASDLQDAGILAKCHINIKQLVDHVEYSTYPAELKYLLENKERIAHIAKMITTISSNGGNTLVLLDRIEPGQLLTSLIPNAKFVSGATKASARKEQYDDISFDTNTILVATYGVASTGINIVNLNNIVLIESGKSFVRVIQSIGRGLRKSDTKEYVDIWDITSTCKFAKRHLTTRKAFYKEANYDFSLEKVKWQ